MDGVHLLFVHCDDPVHLPPLWRNHSHIHTGDECIKTKVAKNLFAVWDRILQSGFPLIQWQMHSLSYVHANNGDESDEWMLKNFCLNLVTLFPSFLLGDLDILVPGSWVRLCLSFYDSHIFPLEFHLWLSILDPLSLFTLKEHVIGVLALIPNSCSFRSCKWAEFKSVHGLSQFMESDCQANSMDLLEDSF